MTNPAASPLPEGQYLFLTSSVREGYAGRTMAMFRRARLFAEVGGRPVTVLVFHGDINWAQHRAYFASNGFIADGVRVLDFYEWLRTSDLTWAYRLAEERGRPAFPEWLTEARDSGTLDLERAYAPEGLLVREYTRIPGARRIIERFRSDGSLYVASRRLEKGFDWDHRERPTVVFDHAGLPLVEFPSVQDLYRVWLRELGRGHASQYLFAEYRPVANCLIRNGLDDDQYLAVTVHNAHTKEPWHWNSPISDRWVETVASAYGYDQIVTLTERQRRDLGLLIGDRDTLATLPHPLVDHPQAVGVERDPDLCLVVARLEPQKDVAHAIRAFETVARRHPTARLEIYGEGSEQARLEALISELGLDGRAELRGFTPDVHGLYARAAVLLFTSRWEGQGMTIPEAFQQGCPVVAYDVKYGPGDMIRDGENGFLLRSRDPERYAEAVLGILGDRAVAQRLSDGARRSAAQYSGEAHVRGWGGLVDAMRERKPRRVRVAVASAVTERLRGLREPGLLRRAAGASRLIRVAGRLEGRVVCALRVDGPGADPAALDPSALSEDLRVRLRWAGSDGAEVPMPHDVRAVWRGSGARVEGTVSVEWAMERARLADLFAQAGVRDGEILDLELLVTLRNDAARLPVRDRGGRPVSVLADAVRR